MSVTKAAVAAGPRAAPPDEPVDLAPLDKLLDDLRGQKVAVIPILQRTQDLYGYVPRAAIGRISRRLRIPISQLFGVATFYAQFRLAKRGRHLVRICDGTACHVRGAPRSVAAIRAALGVAPGETSPDQRMTLEIVYCLGSCGLAPVAVVDDKVLGRLGPDEVVNCLHKLS